ncbi:hypothetical protein HY570_03600 [Candidatus Micrarchaeota archaeon]|nr:hypothetical protein [Candidatus Micrarchaeota archaeon]
MKIKTILHAFQKVYSEKKYLLLTLFAAIGMFLVLTLLPVGRFNEKALYYQITGLDILSLISMGSFSIVFGILISMQIYLLLKIHETKKMAGTAGTGLISLFSSFIAGMFGSVVCLACLSTLFSFLGLGTITFLVLHRNEFFILSGLIALLSVYMAAKGIEAHEKCDVCKV